MRIADIRNYLITGATGFVGSYLTARLVRNGIYPQLLIRAESQCAAAQRLSEALSRFVPISAAAAYPAERILVGDVTQPDCGLQRAERDLLRRDCAGMIHCAAATKFLAPQPRLLRRTNLDGAVHAARLALDLQLPDFYHVSTLYVCGDRVGDFSEEDLDCGQHFANEYESSKLRAEIALRELFAATPRRLTILRPGIIAGDSKSGASHPSCVLNHFFAAFAKLRQRRVSTPDFRLNIPLDPRTPVPLIPVDYFADVCFAAIGESALRGRTIQVTARQPVTLAQLNCWIQSALDMNCVRLAGANAAALPGGKTLLERLLNFYQPYLRDTPDRNSSMRRQPALRRIEFPALDGRSIARMVQFYLRERRAGRAAIPKERRICSNRRSCAMNCC